MDSIILGPVHLLIDDLEQKVVVESPFRPPVTQVEISFDKFKEVQDRFIIVKRGIPRPCIEDLPEILI